MLQVKFIVVGNVKESYFKEACDEYIKRLGGFCRPEICELKETKLPDSPSRGEIDAALSDEADRILAQIPPRAFVTVLAVEGKEIPSEELASMIEKESLTHPCICFVVGSSYGLDKRVKERADFRLSFSKLTFPHRLFRVMLLEAVYRAFTITKGTGYHK